MSLTSDNSSTDAPPLPQGGLGLTAQGQSLFEMALDAVLIADDQGRYVEANPAACRLLNCDRAQILQRTLADFCRLPPGASFEQLWQTFLAQGQMQGEMTLRTGDGDRVVEFLATAHVCPHRHLSILRDVTERKCLEVLQQQLNRGLAQQVVEQNQVLQALQSQLETEHDLLESILDNLGGVVWSLDLTTHTIRYVNAAVETLYGYPTEMFLQDARFWRRLVHPEDLVQIDRELSQIPHQRRFDLEYRLLRADGELRWMHERSRVICNRAGEPLRLDGMTTDITDQKQLEADLRLNESRLRAIFDQAPIGIHQAGLDGNFLQANQAYCDLLGYTEAELRQLRYQDVAHPDEAEATEAAIARLLSGEASSVTLEKRYFHKDGSVRWTNLVLSILRDADGQPISDLAMVQDISDRKQAEIQLQQLTQQLQAANAQLHRMATTDDLTQVANRRHFNQSLTQEWARARREQSPLALIMADVDHFKAYNDHYGHPAGDRCLQQVAQRLRQAIQRPGDLLARYGGEEFVVLLPGTDAAGAIAVADNLRAALAQMPLPHDRSPVAPHITLSLGLASGVPRRGQAASDLLTAADRALYQAKLAGRNRYTLAATAPAAGPPRVGTPQRRSATA